jgi:hypothetical protein
MMHSFRRDKFKPAGWTVLMLIVAALVAHGGILYHLASGMTLASVTVVVLLLLAKHLGLFGSVYAMMRSRSRR